MIKTGEKPQKRRNRIKQVMAQIDTVFAEKLVLLLFVLSVAAAMDNMHLAVLPLVIVQLARFDRTKYICACVGTISFAFTVVHTAFYIPCIAAVLVWLVADYLLDGYAIKAEYPAAVAFAVAKAYVLSFGFEMEYWLVFVLETAAIVTAADAVEAGFEILKNNDMQLSAENIFEVACALGAASLGAGAVQIWAFSLPVAFLLSAAFFYSIKNNFTVSLVAYAMAVLSLCGDKNFALLAVGLGTIYLATVFMLSRGRWGYMGGIAVAAAVAMVTISNFNSLVFVSVTAVSLSVTFVAEKLWSQPPKQVAADTAGGAQAQAVVEMVDRLNRCFRFLGHTVIDISNLTDRDYIPPLTEDTVAAQLCRRCKNSHLCWQQNYSGTQTQFARCAKAVAAGQQPHFDSWFYSICDKTEDIVQATHRANQLATTQKLLHTAGQHSRTLLQGQFIAMADILRDITANAGRQGAANTAFTHSAENFLALCGKKVDYCICYQNPDRCVVSTRDYMTAQETDRFKTKLESLYSCRFAEPQKKLTDGSMLYTFCRVPMFRADSAVKTASRQHRCGDVCEIFTAEGYTYIVLADGMGTGSFAAAESRTAAAMVKSLLTSAVNVQTAMEIVNIALNLKGTGQSCVALDILQINLYNGSCVLFKAGGAETIAVSGGRLQHIYRHSLPVGILKDTNIAQFTFTMNNGDVLLMTSDGVEISNTLCKKLQLAAEKCTSQQLCDFVMEQISANDDATVAAIRLERQ